MSETKDILAAFTGSIDASHPIEFSDDINIEPKPQWLDGRCRNSGLSFEQIKLVLEAKYVVRIMILPVNEEAGTGFELSRIIEKFTLIGMAFYLSGAAWTMGPVFISTQSPSPHQPIRTFVSERSTNVLNSAANPISEKDFNNAKVIFHSLILLNEKSLVRRAVKYLTRAVTEDMLDVRYLLDWIVLETLFGPDDGELSYRIAQRVSFFLANQSAQRKQIFQNIKTGYTWRSKIVHGAKIDSLSIEKSLELTETIESLIRRCLCKILGDASLRESINGKQRNEFLDDLVFQ